MGQKYPQHSPDRSKQQARKPTSDERKDANDMDSNQTDLTQRSGAHRQQVANRSPQGSREPGNQHRQQR